MININGNKFVKSDKDFVNTLFDRGGTAYGFYKIDKLNKDKTRGCVHFYDMQGKLFAALVLNNNGFSSFVLASERENKTFYMHSVNKKERELFGIPDSYTGGIDYANKVFNQIIEGV